MKTKLLLGFLVAFSGPLWAVPQTFGGQGGLFFNGLPLEEFLRDADSWKDGTALPGNWDKADDNQMKTSEVGLIFGEAAQSALAQLDENGKVRSIVVTFETKTAADRAKLKTQLESRIATWAGAPMQKDRVVAHGLLVEFAVAGNTGLVIRFSEVKPDAQS